MAPTADFLRISTEAEEAMVISDRDCSPLRTLWERQASIKETKRGNNSCKYITYSMLRNTRKSHMS